MFLWHGIHQELLVIRDNLILVSTVFILDYVLKITSYCFI